MSKVVSIPEGELSPGYFRVVRSVFARMFRGTGTRVEGMGGTTGAASGGDKQWHGDDTIAAAVTERGSPPSASKVDPG